MTFGEAVSTCFKKYAAWIFLNALCLAVSFLLCLQPGAVRIAHAWNNGGYQANPGYNADPKL